jgi:uncharacterized phage protein (TIGR02218 family)
MTYEDKDTSVHDGSPIYAFKFVGPDGEEYCYTNSDQDETIAGTIYTKQNIECSTIEVTSVLDSKSTIDITLPVNSDLAQLFSLFKSRDRLDVEIREVHRDTDFATESVMAWKGYAVYHSTTGRETTIQTGTVIQAILQTYANTIYYQAPCNHVLYDDRCKVVRSDHTTQAIVTVVNDKEITVDDDGVDNAVLRAGEIKNLRTGERRFIFTNILNVIDIGYAFDDIVIGDTVELTKGCIRSFSECNTKFNNLANYGGFVYVPDDNPFTGEI